MNNATYYTRLLQQLSQLGDLILFLLLLKYEVEGARPRGRPKKTWREIVEKDCKAHGLNREYAMDHSRCRKQIEIIDDHDECEWVNVSSGTSSPRLSQTKSKEP